MLGDEVLNVNSGRRSEFELLRIVAMLMVMILHADSFSLGMPTADDVVVHPVSSYMRYAVKALTLVCVNVYVLISGYFGIKLRFSSMAKFLFMVIFWKVLIIAVRTVAHEVWGIGSYLPAGYLIELAVPGVDEWFTGAYLLLMVLAPVLNAYIEKSSVCTLRNFAIVYCGLQVVMYWMIPALDFFMFGYTPLSFIGLYVTGAAIRRGVGVGVKSPRGAFAAYFVIALAVASLMFIINRLAPDSEAESVSQDMFAAYNGLHVLVCSVLFFVAFSKLRMRHSRLVNTVAESAFAVYLFHMHPLLSGPYAAVCRYLFEHLGTWSYIAAISVFIVVVFAVAVLIDRVRIVLWRRSEPLVYRLYIALRLRFKVE